MLLKARFLQMWVPWLLGPESGEKLAIDADSTLLNKNFWNGSWKYLFLTNFKVALYALNFKMHCTKSVITLEFSLNVPKSITKSFKCWVILLTWVAEKCIYPCKPMSNKNEEIN